MSLPAEVLSDDYDGDLFAQRNRIVLGLSVRSFSDHADEGCKRRNAEDPSCRIVGQRLRPRLAMEQNSDASKAIPSARHAESDQISASSNLMMDLKAEKFHEINQHQCLRC